VRPCMHVCVCETCAQLLMLERTPRALCAVSPSSTSSGCSFSSLELHARVTQNRPTFTQVAIWLPTPRAPRSEFLAVSITIKKHNQGTSTLEPVTVSLTSQRARRPVKVTSHNRGGGIVEFGVNR
jgi:hypothetical protein